MVKPKNVYLSIASVPLLLVLIVFFRNTGWLTITQSPAPAVAAINEPLENIRFTVYDMGIYPREIEVSTGHLGIVFESRTRVDSGFVVQRVNENAFEQVAQISAAANRLRTRGEVKLTPGRYRVFDSSRPEIYSTLVVNP
jgi:hypothetical protein